MPTLTWLEITGFRSFSVKQRLDFTSPLALIWGGNSQGKTSIAEAIEFLMTGNTVRQSLLGGETAEHYSSLRCVHHPKGEQVIVAAGVVDASGVERRVARTLDLDLGRGQERTSTLTIDGQPATGVADVGLVLAEPPLCAPVLFQHSVRYALSAKPSERLAYFKALLELADLDQLTAAISAAVNAITNPQTGLERDLATCAADAILSSDLSAIAEPTASKAATRAAIMRTAATAVVALGESPAADVAFPDAHATQLEAALDALDQRRFDFAAWRPSPDRPTLIASELLETQRMATVAATVEAETARLTALFESVLAVPGYETLDAAVACPVCGTDEALTPERVAFLRSKLGETAEFRAAQIAAREELETLRRELTAARQAIVASSPPIASASEEVTNAASEALAAILGREVDLSPTLTASAVLRERATEATTAVDAAMVAVKAAETQVTDGQAADADTIRTAMSAAVTAVDDVLAHRSVFVEAAKVVLVPAKEALAAQAGTSAYRALARLVRDCDGVVAARRRTSATDRVRSEYMAALRDIERAKLAVLNAKFAGMSDEIKRWWDLLRPDEPVAFHRAAARGQGLRAMALEASLKGSDDAMVVRDALGVLSDSQLNALGLSAFLARASLQRTPLIVLDDPVQSGDEAHRDTFIDYVVPALLAAGFQVIVTTFDHGFRTLISKAHKLDGFQVDLDDPTRGSAIVNGTHSSKALLNDAKGFISDGQSVRSIGASRLRVAAEAIAKDVLVHSRTTAGERCSLADYTKWSLDKLVKELAGPLPDKEYRWWTTVSQRLSPGSHDDAPPEKATLKVVYQGLKQTLKDHGGP
jgi:hypothetical protein